MLVALAPHPSAAQSTPAPSSDVFLIRQPDDMLSLSVSRVAGDSIAVLLGSNASQCRFPENAFDLPVQINDTGFQLKLAIRPTQNRERDDSCTEAVAIAYRPEDYWPLKTATAVTLHLPWGPLRLTDDALAHLRTIEPRRPPQTLPTDSDQYIDAINRLTSMVAAGQARQAREAAEALLPAFALRPPDEAFAFFATLGMARRMTGDLPFAASSLEVAIRLAPMTKAAPNVGVVYDNLSTVRGLQQRWTEAEQASDRAIASLEGIDHPQARRALGGVYNNRALTMFNQQKYEAALAFSEKALVILKATFADQPKELEPFLEDNRKIREKIARP